MLMPNITKYRKKQGGKNRGAANRGNTIAFGEIGVFAAERGLITSRQIESARISIMRTIKRGGKVWIRIFPDKPISRKPAETRMGKGKGDTEYWAAVIKPGRCLFEIGGVAPDLAEEALRKAEYKLPIKTRIRLREEN